MPTTRWETRDPADPVIAQNLVRELGISALLASLLTSRDITDPGEADHFLHPRLASLPDPLATPGLEAAARRIALAVERAMEAPPAAPAGVMAGLTRRPCEMALG